MQKSVKIVLILAIIVIVLSSEGECRDKRPGRKRMRPPGSKPRIKRPRFSLFKSRGTRPRIPPGIKDLGEEQSKQVYYYSVPRSTLRPRIILGEELNFDDLGMLPPEKGIKTKRPLSNWESDLEEENLNTLPNPEEVRQVIESNSDHRHVKSLPKGRGPGYRMKGSLSEHYVLTQDYEPKKPRRPAVIPSMRRAAAEIRNAYTSALIQSAKVAKYTTQVASNYFKGVRNIFLSDIDEKKRPSYRGRADSLDAEPTNEKPIEVIPPLPKKEQVQIDQKDKEAIEKLLPNVYLDWGGSFWKLFYKTSHEPTS
ncbi:unnamed protein product [Orchesella dallaii]|uniref:Uncharacterized protein n=1 Tax=Orchesella dallaii TaxID=48710 RepID=A0ABP1QAK6_9HEXA